MTKNKQNTLTTYHETSEFLQFTLEEFQNWLIGNLILSISTGEFNQKVKESIWKSVDWYLYHQEHYKLGKKIS